MYKICKTCGSEKEIQEFVRQKHGYRHKCKECKNKLRRTGKVNEGRFKKGCISLRRSNTKKGYLNTEWKKKVKERDNWKCQSCGCEERSKLHAHHIVRWKDDESKRYDLDNGITYCASCHFKTEGNNIGGWNRGIKGSVPGFKGPHTEETKNKIRESLKGRIPWRKGSKNAHKQ